MKLDKTQKVFIAGSTGMVGQSICAHIGKNRFDRLLLKSSFELDLRVQSDVEAFFSEERPDVVIMSAAKIGSIILCKEAPAEYLYDNLAMEMNVIQSAHKSGVKKLLFTASSNVYPEHVNQPIFEESLMTGKLEETREPYALAKLVGVKMCDMYRNQYGLDYFSVIPCNLYGPNDRFDPINAHVVPALIRKFHEAKEDGSTSVTVWGTGAPLKEFMYVDDLAEACLFLLDCDSREYSWYNVGTGIETSVHDLAEKIAEIVGYGGEIVFDTSKPDGVMRHVMDCSRIKSLGWESKVDLDEGLRRTYDWFLENKDNAR